MKITVTVKCRTCHKVYEESADAPDADTRARLEAEAHRIADDHDRTCQGRAEVRIFE
jgi:hypothetical protein